MSEQLLLMAQEHFYKILVTGFFAGLGFLGKAFLNAYKKSVETKKQAQEHEVKEQELIKEGLISLLRFRINRLCTHAKEQGFLYIDEKGDLDDLFKSYIALGGNSSTKRRYEFTCNEYATKDRSY